MKSIINVKDSRCTIIKNKIVTIQEQDLSVSLSVLTSKYVLHYIEVSNTKYLKLP